MKELINITVKSLTPIMIGGADKSLDSVLRGASLRGMLRWWSRATVAGAAIQAGKDELDAVNKIIPMLLGGTIKKESEASKTVSSRIKIIVNSNVRPLNSNELYRYVIQRVDPIWDNRKRRCKVRITYKHQRLSLLFMDLSKEIIRALNIRSYDQCRKIKMDVLKRELEKVLSNYIGFLEKADIKLVTLSKKISTEDRFIALNLIIGLIFSGVGKGARRGLGALKIERINTEDDELKKLLPRIADHIKADQLRYLINNALKLGIELINKVNINSRNNSTKLPAIPAIHPNYSDFFIIVDCQDLWGIICRLNKELFLRPWSLGKKLRGIQNSKQSVNQLAHYILGLPRSGKGRSESGIEVNIFNGTAKLIKGSNKTGFVYSIERKKEARRASPVFLSAIDKNTISIIVFKSEDWPGKSNSEILEWFTTKNQLNNRNIPRVVTLYTAYKILQNLEDGRSFFNRI